MQLAVAAHVLLAVVVVPLARRLGPRVFLVAAAVPAATFGWAISQAMPVLGGDVRTAHFAWAARIGLHSVLRLDSLGLLMTLLVTGVGALVLVYCAYYVERAASGRIAGLLSLFAGSMLGLVLADDVFTLYVFWELTTLCSFLLVGGDGKDTEVRRAGAQALLVTVAGGFAMLLGLVLLAEAGDTYRVSELVANPPSGPTVHVALLLLLLGACTKSAQLPFHPWLPGAMVAPAPVSAYLHAAAMVKAGVYLVARFSPGFGAWPTWWVPATVIGLATMLLGGYRALLSTDVKMVLAYSTVSQLGMLTVLACSGTRVGTLAAGAMLLAHGLFKSSLFLAAGIIDHQAGIRDMRQMSGIGRKLPVLAVSCGLAVASMAGVPPFIGYVGKEAAFEAFAHGGTVDALVFGGLVLGSALTVGYGIRLLRETFAGKRNVATTAVRAPRIGLLGPAIVPAVAGLALGIGTPVVSALAEGIAPPPSGGDVYHLGLWHGFGLPLVGSAIALAAGYLTFRAVPWMHLHSGVLPRSLHAQRMYQLLVTGLEETAHRVTGRTQVGSLPIYLGVILVSVSLLTGAGLVAGVPVPRDIPWWDEALQVPLALAVLVAAAAMVVVRRRFTAVLLAGVVGYGIGALFLVHGASDVALAQFLVESMVLVVFVFVLRRLPGRFTGDRPVRAFQRAKAVVATLAGGVVAVAAVLYSGARRSTSEAGQEYLARAKPEAGASNVVNAILMDFRALDTVGEISVLTVAIIGAASLILAAGHPGRRARDGERGDTGGHDGAGLQDEAGQRDEAGRGGSGQRNRGAGRDSDAARGPGRTTPGAADGGGSS